MLLLLTAFADYSSATQTADAADYLSLPLSKLLFNSKLAQQLPILHIFFFFSTDQRSSSYNESLFLFLMKLESLHAISKIEIFEL